MILVLLNCTSDEASRCSRRSSRERFHYSRSSFSFSFSSAIRFYSSSITLLYDRSIASDKIPSSVPSATTASLDLFESRFSVRSWISSLETKLTAHRPGARAYIIDASIVLSISRLFFFSCLSFCTTSRSYRSYSMKPRSSSISTPPRQYYSFPFSACHNCRTGIEGNCICLGAPSN